MRAIAIVFFLVACAREERKPAPAAAATVEDPAAAVLRGAAVVLPGPHRITETATVSVARDGKAVESLSEQGIVERGAGGELHAAYANSKDHGREIYAAAGTVWVRPRYGKYHRRPPAKPDEAERAAAEIGGLLAAQLDLVAPGVEIVDAGAVTEGGRPAKKLTLRRGAGRARPPSAGPKAWRDSVSVEEVEGELTVDDATGALLGGRLAARVGFVRDGDRLEMTLGATRQVVPGPVTITLPSEDQSTPTPLRTTEFDDREELLSGLAAPGRKAPVPKGVTKPHD